MSDARFALFDTAIGHCGIAWNTVGIAGVNLPEAAPSNTRKRLHLRFNDAVESEPPDYVMKVIRNIRALTEGERVNFQDVQLDMSGIPAFRQQTYACIRTIAVGSTRTYGEVAAQLGKPGAARAVGTAMRLNPFPVIVPCHRVVAANGRPGGFSAVGGTGLKIQLLRIEGVTYSLC